MGGHDGRAPDREGAIGIFDSGVGGLTVVQALAAALPREHLIYLGDTGRHPYGTKSPETVTRYSLDNVEFLVERGVKMVVVACNTASSVALGTLAARYPFPTVGVIQPGARAALARTTNGRIGVIGTEGTISSGAYTRALRALRPTLEIFTRSCPLLVPLAEEGWLEGPVPRGAVETYLASLRTSGIDTLVLGCTHYPLLKPLIAEVMGDAVALVDSAEETARDVAALLEAHDLGRRRGSGSASFFVTDVPDRFIRTGQRFLGARLDSAVRVER
jgi:glutamate racemase